MATLASSNSQPNAQGIIPSANLMQPRAARLLSDWGAVSRRQRPDYYIDLAREISRSLQKGVAPRRLLLLLHCIYSHCREKERMRERAGKREPDERK
jgi:hypothetical protein